LHYHTDLHGDTSYTAVSLNKNESRSVKRDLDCVAITGSHLASLKLIKPHRAYGISAIDIANSGRAFTDAVHFGLNY